MPRHSIKLTPYGMGWFFIVIDNRTKRVRIYRTGQDGRKLFRLVVEAAQNSSKGQGVLEWRLVDEDFCLPRNRKSAFKILRRRLDDGLSPLALG